MDIDALHSALLSITIASDKLRNSRDKIGELDNVPLNLCELLDEAVNDVRMTKATLAGGLGFSLCPRCWPAELLTTDSKGRLSCPVCGEVSLKRAA